MSTSATVSEMVFDRTRRGEVWLVALGASVGHELTKTRPAVVISADHYNTHVRNGTVLVVPLKGRVPEKPVRYDEVEITAPEGGLQKDCVTATNQLRVVSVERLVRRMGIVTEETMENLGRKAAFVLGFTEEV